MCPKGSASTFTGWCTELGPKAEAPSSVPTPSSARLAAGARSGDTVALLSNGSFGGAHEKVLAALRDGGSPTSPDRGQGKNEEQAR